MDVKTLQEAVTKGDLDAVVGIVEQDPSLVNQDDEYEWRPIFHAGLRRHYDIVKYLIDQMVWLLQDRRREGLALRLSPGLRLRFRQLHWCFDVCNLETTFFVKVDDLMFCD